eukprot:m.302773 g.302773  ORF g.302773 m.302773 type:complete len:642 (+) comp40827_c0_seq3:1136-3061(+)
MSMVGRHQLSLVHRRLCQAFPNRADCSFGGLSIILFGDIGQLPPVGESPLYSGVSGKLVDSNRGRQLYLTFDVVVQLTQIMRQSGGDHSQIKFREALLRLRLGRPTYEDWHDLYMSRNFSVHEQKGEAQRHFSKAVRLFACREDVAEFNLNCLKNSQKPVAVIDADHNCKEARAASEDIAGGLYPTVRLCEGARVMLTSNLWTEMGLVNGAMGDVVAILYSNGNKPPALPETVVVRMDKYDGPSWGGERYVPICPIERNWSGKMSCRRRQLPLQLAWAVTVHKSQGLTLDRAVVDIGKREFASGITYVALSRVRKLNNCLIQSFDFERIAKLYKSKSLQQRLKEDDRLAAIAAQTDCLFQSSTDDEMIRDFFLKSPDNMVDTAVYEVCDDSASESDAEEPTDRFHIDNQLAIATEDKPTDDDVKFVTTKQKKPAQTPLFPPSPTAILQSMARATKAIDGDGNCYFRCLAQAAFGSQEQHLMLRSEIVNFMTGWKDLFHTFAPDDRTYEEHMNLMKKCGEWATQSEIHATATLFQIDIRIFSWFGNRWEWAKYRPLIPMPVPAHLQLGVSRVEILHYVNHFDLIVPINRSDSVLAASDNACVVAERQRLWSSHTAAAAQQEEDINTKAAAVPVTAGFPAKEE